MQNRVTYLNFIFLFFYFFFTQGGNDPYKVTHDNYPEFNFKYDHVAAKIVFDEYLCPITVYTFECCLRSFDIKTNTLIEEFNKYIETSKRCRFLERIAIPHRLASENPHVFVCCDLLAVLGLFHGEECKAVFQKLDNFTIQSNGSDLDGLLVKRKDSVDEINSNIEICVTMDSSMTFQIFATYLEKLKQSDEYDD